jgi:hypothetical protein
MPAIAQGRVRVMRLQTFRDDSHARHLELIGSGWSIDLVTMGAAALLVAGFGCAIANYLLR